MKAMCLIFAIVILVACTKGTHGGSSAVSSSSGIGGSAMTSASVASTGGGGGSTSATTVDASSSSGPLPECVTPLDCQGVDTDCAKRACDGGKCSTFYPVDAPIDGQVPGDCAVTVCDGSGGVKPNYDSSDVVQIPGDCKVRKCVGIGQTSDAYDQLDQPMSDECNTGFCSPQGGGLSPVAPGTECSTGLCKDGACKQFIQVSCCGDGVGCSTACAGPANDGNVSWTDAMNVKHTCFAADETQADYCPPGTPCTFNNFGVMAGFCQ